MSEGKLQLEIITPEGIQLDVRVDELTAPSVQGQFGVLPGHRPMLASLATGLISFSQNGGPLTQVAVGPGHVQVDQDRAVVLTEKYSEKKSIDPVVVRLELKTVDEELERYTGDRSGVGYARLVADELWAAALLELYGDPPPPTQRGFDETSSRETEQGLEAQAD